jgi:4-hydroxybenzoate polyprenyltransferase
MATLTQPTEATGLTGHRRGSVWLVGAVSMLVGFCLAIMMPILALVLAACLIAGSALRRFGQSRHLLLAIGLGFAVSTLVYFGLAVARH